MIDQNLVPSSVGEISQGETPVSGIVVSGALCPTAFIASKQGLYRVDGPLTKLGLIVFAFLGVAGIVRLFQRGARKKLWTSILEQHYASAVGNKLAVLYPVSKVQSVSLENPNKLQLKIKATSISVVTWRFQISNEQLANPREFVAFCNRYFVPGVSSKN